MEKSYFASGCFWGTEYYFAKLKGVSKTVVGYSGGHLENPTYKQVCGGETDHLECIEVSWDPTQTNYENVLKYFFETHDFSQTDGQGPDIGAQYLSAIFYKNPEELNTAQEIIQELKNKGYSVATKLLPFERFWPAEDYHQQYYINNGKTPYCHTYKPIF